MSMYKVLIVPLVAFFLCETSLQSMVYDNRYMPLYARPYARRTNMPSNFMANAFFMVGNDAYLEDGEDAGIPEILGPVTATNSIRGKFNQVTMGEALTELGLSYIPIPLSLSQNSEIIWNIKGKIQTQGAAFQWDQYIGKNISIGATWFFMHLFSRQEFMLNPAFASSLQQGEFLQLDASRRSMLDAAGVTAVKISENGFSDIDAYIRFGGVWNYPYKFRRIDLGGKLGLIIPSGKTRILANPASIPFGGDGFWGMYGAFDAEFELKEDLNVGLLLRVNHRFKKDVKRRLPLEREHQLYAPYINKVEVSPGATVVFSPYLRFDALREGVGLEVRYTTAVHEDDCITDVRTVKDPTLTLVDMRKTSFWNAEYLTFTATYDFSYDRIKCDFVPYFYFMWDMPVSFFVAQGVAKTNRASIGVEIHY